MGLLPQTRVIQVDFTRDMRLEIRYGEQSSLEGRVEIRIQPGDSVRWEFTGMGNLQADWTPNILFPSGTPFASTRRSTRAFEGFENQGDPGTFEFIAVLQDNRFPRLTRILSSHAFLWQSAKSVDVEIHFEEEIFSVAPKSISFAEGTPVLWRFHGLENGFHPSLFFTTFIPENSRERKLVNNYFGPFDNIVWGPDGLTGSGTSGIKGKFYYLVRLTSGLFEENVLELKAIHSIDPDVDNEQDPVAGDPEGPPPSP